MRSYKDVRAGAARRCSRRCSRSQKPRNGGRPTGQRANVLAKGCSTCGSGRARDLPSLPCPALRAAKAESHFVNRHLSDVGYLSRDLLSQRSGRSAPKTVRIALMSPSALDQRMHSLFDRYLHVGFSTGEIHPLPKTVYAAQDTISALRDMSHGKHRGKIVIDFTAAAPTGKVRNTFSAPRARPPLSQRALQAAWAALHARAARSRRKLPPPAVPTVPQRPQARRRDAGPWLARPHSLAALPAQQPAGWATPLLVRLLRSAGCCVGGRRQVNRD
jgi:hypothetical protein